LGDIARWRASGRQVALARVVGTDGSGPRDPGAAMAVNEDSEVVGSVSGGCVEGAVLTEGLKVLERGIPKLVTYGIADDALVLIRPDGYVGGIVTADWTTAFTATAKAFSPM